MKIAIYGVGGVGGYFAAQASDYFKGDSTMEFYYIARGEHLKAIKDNGLKLLRDNSEPVLSYPTLATDDIRECGKLDYIIYTTKSYSIEENLDSLRAVSDENTKIITFMNGVDGAEKLKKALPDVTVCEGCVYVYSKILSPGVISETGSLAHYMIGDKRFCDIFSPAIDKISYFENIDLRIWNKFAYISPFATLTTWHNTTSDKIAEIPEYSTAFEALCNEFEAVALARGVDLEPGLFERNSKLRAKSPVGSTSSMQRDYHSGRQSEVYSLTSYISELGAKLGVATPYYDKASKELLRRIRKT